MERPITSERQQVGRKLYALKGAVERSGQRVGQRGFADARNIFDQQVAPGNQGHDCQAHCFRLPLDNCLDRGLQTVDLSIASRGDRGLLAFYGIETSHQVFSIRGQIRLILHAKTRCRTSKFARPIQAEERPPGLACWAFG